MPGSTSLGKPGVHEAVAEGIKLPVGVEGISWHGFGLIGVSLNLDPRKLPTTQFPTTPSGRPVFPEVADTASGSIQDAIEPPVRNDTRPAGVLGLSVEGAGVRGVSRLDRGGIFQSAMGRYTAGSPFPDGPVVAQIRLVPHLVLDLKQDTPNPVLPEDGQTGDLLSVVAPDRNHLLQTASLWFCERGKNGASPARWRLVNLTDRVVGGP
jgi:hypothetical protein